jgi:hypothetical protein
VLGGSESSHTRAFGEGTTNASIEGNIMKLLPHPIWRRSRRHSVIALSILLAASACTKGQAATPEPSDGQVPYSLPSLSPSVPSPLPSPAVSSNSPLPTGSDKVTIPDLVGLTKSQATSLLTSLGLGWKIKSKFTDDVPPGTVLSQSRLPGAQANLGGYLTFTIAKAPPPPPTTPPPAPPTTQPPPSNCDPAYPGVCLHDGIGDYDCAGGSGNGPNYVSGPIRVLAPDPFGLDADGDGWGCE